MRCTAITSTAWCCLARARCDARPDSDYDVAVFLKSLPDRWAELDRLARLRVKMIDETGGFFDVKPYPAAALREHTPLMHEIRQDDWICEGGDRQLS
jgi:hypothetical protein